MKKFIFLSFLFAGLSIGCRDNDEVQQFKSDAYGINTGILGVDEPYFSAAIDQAASLGVGWIRIGDQWPDTEPTDNNWNFSVADEYINAAISRGLNILYTFDPDLNGTFCTMSPAQASLGGKPLCTDEQFKDYISKIVSRYKGKITYYELGNEPDLRITWRDNPVEYANALALAYSALKAADPNAMLLIGGLARGGQNSDPQYPQKLIAAGALNNFDIFNYHTYSQKDDITNAFNQIKAAVGNKPIWITEIGYPSDSKQQEVTRVGYPYPPGEDGQVAYMKDILPHILSLGVEKVFWYTLVDVPRDSGDFCTYGVVNVSGKQCVGGDQRDIDGAISAKKSFDAYKELTSAR